MKQSNATQWNSTLEMLTSVQDAMLDIQQVISAHKPKELHRVASIDQDLLSEIILFLTPFRDATKDCEAQLEPTLHQVIPWIKKLAAHCEVHITCLLNQNFWIVE